MFKCNCIIINKDTNIIILKENFLSCSEVSSLSRRFLTTEILLRRVIFNLIA